MAAACFPAVVTWSHVACRAAEASHDAQDALKDAEETLQKPINWDARPSEGVWSKIKKTVTGTPPTAQEKAEEAAKQAIKATQKRAEDAVSRAKQVRLRIPHQGPLYATGGRKHAPHLLACLTIVNFAECL